MALKQVIVRKPDLDAIGAAALAGVTQADWMLCLVGGEAPADLLADPAILCLECGGSGQVNLGNFDHHGAEAPAATAVEQMYDHLGSPSAWREIVDYIAWVDSGGLRGQASPSILAPETTLSGLLSGLFLLEPDLAARFWLGAALVREAQLSGLAPWNLQPGLDHYYRWRVYAEAKSVARQSLVARRDQVRLIHSALAPWPILALSCDLPGAHGLLRDMGGRVRLAHRPGDHFTISVDDDLRPWLAGLLEFLNQHDPGWGGPSGGAIIGSPFGGSKFTFEAFCRLLETADVQPNSKAFLSSSLLGRTVW
ncbi:MAG: hypothetical protein LBP55_01850 [Candidatus Adiutrix sp.]|nr:hypothetical protein [Candidatus Adiutrix sp.]